MQKFFTKQNIPYILLWVFIVAYILFFSTLTIFRYQKLWASYFDLGIMHQTVYNTYKGIQTGDFSRILEMTDPHMTGLQVKRMSVHNDIILALLAPFYFISDSPITLLLIQTIAVALGAYAVFKIAEIIFRDKKYNKWVSLLFSFSYLMYPAMQRATIFDFHAVVLSTSMLLFMYYNWMVKRYIWSIFFLILCLLTKEQVGLTTAFFGIYVYLVTYFDRWKKDNVRFTSWKDFLRAFIPKNDTVTRYAVFVIAISLVWFILSFGVIIPAFRGEQHFATKYYGDYGDSPFGVIVSVAKNPFSIFGIVFKYDSLRYLFLLFSPLAFLSLFSPAHFFIAAPEFGVNLISNSWAMKQIFYHYTAVLQPFIFISAIYGARNLISWKKKIIGVSTSTIVIIVILLSTVLSSYLKSPLPYSREADLVHFGPYGPEDPSVQEWRKKLQDETIKVSTTGHMAPFFTSRRYFYDFTDQYVKADYVLIQEGEVYSNFQQDITIPAYEKLKIDKNFEKIYDKNGIEVYKKIAL